MVNVGIMSFAHMHAHSYAACLKQLPGVKLGAIWDDSAKRGADMSQTFHTPFIPKLDDFLATDIDAVIICSENIKHRAMVEAAAKAGKWILCEKPLATTVKDATAMVQACDKAGVGLGTAFPCRFVTPLMEVKRRLDAGEIGELYMANCTNNGSFPGGWFAKDELAGGGATMDHTVHVADVLRWITGREFTKVYCEKGAFIRRNLKTDDCGALHLEMEGGIKVAHVASWNRAASFPTWGDVTLELIGEKGVINCNAFGQKLDVYSDKHGKGEWAHWGDNADLALVQDFVQAVAQKRPMASTGLDGLRAVEVTVAAYKSAKAGKAVAV